MYVTLRDTCAVASDGGEIGILLVSYLIFYMCPRVLTRKYLPNMYKIYCNAILYLCYRHIRH